MSVDFCGLRVKMVDGQVRTTDVTDHDIIDAMLSVPREAFVESKRKALAYIDEDILISGSGAPARYMMEPSPFAKLVQLAEIEPDDIVLDVGCGTGYSSAVLSRLAQSVVAVECDPALARMAAKTLADLSFANALVVEGPLASGHAASAPYNVIFIGGAVEQLPEALFSQLKEGGRLVVVEGRGNAATARLYLKSNRVVTGRRAFNAAVKPLPGFERLEAFEF